MRRSLYALLSLGGLVFSIGCCPIGGYNDCAPPTHPCLFPYAGVGSGNTGGAVILNAEPIPVKPKDKSSGSDGSASISRD